MTSTAKEIALRIIQQMPDDASLEDIMHQLHFRTSVDAGLEELREGKVVPHAEVVADLKRRLATGEYWQS